MRTLLVTIVLFGSVATASADEPADKPAAPELLVMPDLEAESGARVRFGLATLDNVNGSDRSAQAALLTAVRASYAARPDLEVSLAVSSATLAYTNRDGIVGGSFDGGLGLPALGVEWSRPVRARVRAGVGALVAIGARDPGMFNDPYPADVAAGAFFADPEVVWTQAHMGLVHGGVGWSDGDATLHADLGIQGYAGGTLPEAQSILRLSGGLAGRFGDRVSLSLEALLESDVHQEGFADATDLVPAVTAGIRRSARWDLGFGVSRAWTQARAGTGEAGLVFLIDLSRKY